MDTNNWRPSDNARDDFTTQLPPPHFRKLIAFDLTERLYRHFLYSGKEVPDVQEMKKIAVYFEEQIYTSSTSKIQYLQQVHLTMWAVEAMPRCTCPDPCGNHIQGEPLLMPEVCGRILSQNTPSSNTLLGSTGVESCASLTSAQPLFSVLQCTTPILNALAHKLTTTQNSEPVGGTRQPVVVREVVQQKLRQGFQYVYQQILILNRHNQESVEHRRGQFQMEHIHQQLKRILRTNSWQSRMKITSSTMQLASGLNPGQGNALSQNSAPLQGNVTDISSSQRRGVNMLQPNIPLQQNPYRMLLQHQHQQMLLCNQQLKQQQELRKQQQPFNPQAKQNLPAQMKQAHQMPQRNDFDEIKIPDVAFQQQMKPGASFHISTTNEKRKAENQANAAAAAKKAKGDGQKK